MRLKECLQAKGLKQADLARYLGVRTSLISYYANNEDVMPSADNLCKIADYLHITTDELLGRDTNLVNLACLDTKTQEVVKQVLELSGNQLDLALQFINALKK